MRRLSRMSDFWNTMFKALEQTSAEEWETFVDNFDASNQAFYIDDDSYYKMHLDDDLLDLSVANDLAFAA